MPTRTASPSADNRIRRLFLGNLARRLSAGESDIEQWDIPLAMCTVGYTGAAKILGTSSSAIRHYWRTDLMRGYSQLMPEPDVIIARSISRTDGTEETELLPGWTETTIRDWIPFRVSSGNHTRGEGRQGNTKGRKNWTKASGRVSAEAAEPAAQAPESDVV